ncbi:MAG: CNNM domain-containing protein [Gemmatimonadota bacterium]
MDIPWRLTLAPILIGMNAFFVAVEFALTRLPSLDLNEDDVSESPGLRRARSMLDRLEIHLTGCQLGISASSVLLGVLAEPAVTALIEPVVGAFGLEGPSVGAISVGTAVVLLNLAHKIWGEQAPTYLGVERPRQVAEHLAPILYWWSKIMGPLIRLGDGAAKATLRLFHVEITRSWADEEVEGKAGGSDGEVVGDRVALQRRMAQILVDGQVPEDRREEVLASLEIDRVPCGEIMVPVAEVVPLALDVSSRENRERIGRSGHTRYPVLVEDAPGREDIRTSELAGILYVPGLFSPVGRLEAERLELEDLLEDPVTCDPGLPVAALIDRLQNTGQEMAAVCQEDHISGFVTITDALEVITGEIRDPLDETVA